MVALSDPGWVQGAFSTLLGLFEKVDLKTNVGKTVRMVCRLCQVAGTQEEAAYENGQRARGLPNRIDSVSGDSAQSAGRRWRWGFWKSIYISSMGRQWAVYGIGGPHPLAESHAPIIWIFQPPGDQGTDPSRGVGDGR